MHMDFTEHNLPQIKNKVSSICSYADILKLKYIWDIEQCLNDTIDLYFSDMWDIKRFIIAHNGQQIGDCKIVVDQKQKNYFVSSIAIVENLQKNWITSSLYKKIIIPKMEILHPGFEFVAAPKQTNLWKKLRKSDNTGITQSPSSLDR